MTRRRSTFQDEAVSYAAVGATAADDVLAYPPRGFRSAATQWHIGSGAERFDWCEENLLSWRMIDAAGFRLEHVKRASADGYTTAGESASHASGAGEVVYARDGRSFITPGDVVTITWGRGGRRERHFRVVAVNRELNMASVTLGTLDTEPFVGEFLIGIEYRPDGTVWSKVVQVVAPGSLRTSRFFFPGILAILSRVRTRIARGLNPARVAHARETVTDAHATEVTPRNAEGV
ncbi:MAG: DUF1990 family protein [Actinobacteria bacterium]|uniref:Unannotated protein n=1 Tax=freshwater metagenome TaxID=449393 RepID=A0A6J7FUH8_9ZZZZ|nr:DUF1990 family protein [Actinomycetota bacterium]